MEPEISTQELVQGINIVLRREIYVDPSLREYTEAFDIHPQRMLVVGPRQSMVDDGIREMLELLWKANCDTVLSCQGGPHKASVVFASKYHGGLRFCAMLEQDKVPYETVDHTGVLASPKGPIPWHTVSVRFDPKQIPIITQLLRDDKLPKANPPAPMTMSASGEPGSSRPTATKAAPLLRPPPSPGES